jgi:diacylglycerol kinase family enzyme
VRSLALLVNPHAAGGRPLRLLPRVEARLRELGLPFSIQRTQSLLHGCELAREAAGRGETPVTLSATSPTRCSACSPADAATTSRG